MSQIDFLVMGADGQQGIISSRFLKKRGYGIRCSDIYRDNIYRDMDDMGGVDFSFCDHRHPCQINEIISTFKPRVVLNCANDLYNDDVLEACIRNKVQYVDLGSGIPDTKRRLARFADAADAGITAIMGAGSVPGIGSVMMRSISHDMTTIESAEGGFAYDSNRPDFVPPFFLYITLWELSLPVAVLCNGEITTIPARSVSRMKNFKLIGDQLLYAVSHSEIFSYHHYFSEKGLKDMMFYAGFPEHHRNVLDALIRVGLAVDRTIPVITSKGEVAVHPSDFLNAMSKYMFYPDGYTEAETLWARATGVMAGRKVSNTMSCIVPPISGWEKYGSNVDTGFPAAVMAEMVLAGLPHGVYCPEGIIPCDEFFGRMREVGFSFETEITPP